MIDVLDRLYERRGLLLRKGLRKALGWVSTENLLENIKPREEGHLKTPPLASSLVLVTNEG